MKSSAGSAGVPLSSRTVTPESGDVAGVGDEVGEGHRAADRHHRPGGGVGILAVGQLHQIDGRHGTEVVVGVGVGHRRRPGGGVPVAVPRLVYWPAVAMRDAVKVQVSVGSSRPLALASPPTKVASKSSAGLAGVPLSSVTVTPDSGTLPVLVTM